MKYYTGIGSRETPDHILEEMMKIGSEFCQLQDFPLVLRSGKAGGADEAFQIGVEQTVLSFPHYLSMKVNEACEIYTPWKRFKNCNLSDRWDLCFPNNNYEKCAEIASRIHPAWNRCSQGAKKLHARNVLQVLGKNLDSPSEFVIYYAKEDSKGNVSGGTRTAVMLAREYGIPTINMLFDDWESRLEFIL